MSWEALGTLDYGMLLFASFVSFPWKSCFFFPKSRAEMGLFSLSCGGRYQKLNIAEPSIFKACLLSSAALAILVGDYEN